MDDIKEQIIQYANQLKDDLTNCKDSQSLETFLKNHMFPTDRRKLGDLDDYVVQLFANEVPDILATLSTIEQSEFRALSRNKGLSVQRPSNEELAFWYLKKEGRFYLRGILHAFLSNYF